MVFTSFFYLEIRQDWDRMTQFSKMSISNYLSFCKIAHPKFSNTASHENEILNLNWCISKNFYRIWEVEVSKSMSMNKYLESKTFKQ